MKHLLLAAAFVATATCALAEGQMHKVAIHVDQNDPQVMNMALNNITNLMKYYADQGDTVEVELVTYGPGLHMLIVGKSPVADRIATMALEHEGIQFSACANTMEGMKRTSGAEVTLLDEAGVVPSGVVRLIELQEDGFAYVKP